MEVFDRQADAELSIIMPVKGGSELARLAVGSLFQQETRLKLHVILIAPETGFAGFEWAMSHPNITMARLLNYDARYGYERETARESASLGMELGIQIARSQLAMTVHSDTLALKHDCLSYLKGKLSEDTIVAGFFQEFLPGRLGAIHCCGMMFARTLFLQHGVSLSPKDELDTGNQYTLFARSQGKGVFVCPNTHASPELADRIHLRQPALAELDADMAVDDEGDVCFLHLGRGTPRVMGMWKPRPGKRQTSLAQWVTFAEARLRVQTAAQVKG